MENNDKIPGKGAATASMVLGIISVVLWFFGYSALVSVIWLAMPRKPVLSVVFKQPVLYCL